MILVDTSIWVDHLADRSCPSALDPALQDGQVVLHPAVLGELALGHVGPRRGAILAAPRALPAAPMARDDDALRLVEIHRLQGSGIGWVDAHLLASALLGDVRLLTRDRNLGAVAQRLGLLP